MLVLMEPTSMLDRQSAGIEDTEPELPKTLFVALLEIGYQFTLALAYIS